MAITSNRAGAFQQAVTLQKRHGQSREPALLAVVDGFGRMARLARLPRLDLDEDDRLAGPAPRDRVRPGRSDRRGRESCSRGGADIARPPPRPAGRASSSGRTAAANRRESAERSWRCRLAGSRSMLSSRTHRRTSSHDSSASTASTGQSHAMWPLANGLCQPTDRPMPLCRPLLLGVVRRSFRRTALPVRSRR